MYLDCWFVLLGFAAGISLGIAATWRRTPKDEPSDDALDALGAAEAALMDACVSEDGLDGDDALCVAHMCSDALRKHGRRSKFCECGQGPVV